MSARFGPRFAIVAAILTLVVAVIGFVATLILNAFVLDEYHAYGEVPVPGSRSLQLPAGEVTVSFHTVITGRPTSGFPIPDLQFNITPPEGVSDPKVIESIGGTTTVNSDTHVRVWVVQIAEEGSYDVVTNGNVNGYISPRLAFGHGSAHGWLVWVFGGLFVLGLLELFAALIWSARSAKRARPLGTEEALTGDQPTWNANPGPSASSYSPTADGVRVEQLKSLAALRDSGALTQEEFEAEKRRILDS
jgi:hypothetical protein